MLRNRKESVVSVMKSLMASCAALSLGLFLNVPLADAFGTETMSNANPDGTTRFVDPDEQMPVQRLDEGGAGASAHILNAPSLKLPTLGRTEDKPQPDSPAQGSTFDPEENRLVFGPFNHFGYGNSNQ